MLKDLVKANRSYRGYDESYQFTREQMEELVDLTRYTASSVNQQPLKYYIAYEKDEVAKIQALTRWAKGLPDLELPHKGKYPTAFVVICQDKEISTNLARFQRDIGIVAQTMLLSAVEQGLGGCMIGNFPAGELAETLHFTENIAPILIVALGKPDEKIVLEEVSKGESIAYYRDDKDVHHVPKRKLSDILLDKGDAVCRK